MDVSVDNEVIVNTNGTVEVAVGNAADAVVADDHALDITVTKKEYKIVGDEVYIAKLYDDAPQWMKDLVQLVVDNTMETESVMLRNDLIGQLNQFATSYVPLNQYTQSILDLSNADTSMHATLETLNSNFNDGLDTANSQIIDLQSTKASKTEVATKVIETLTAQLATPTSELGATIGNLQQTIVDGDSANADSYTTLVATLEGLDGDIGANASAVTALSARVSDAEGTLTANSGAITTLSTGLANGIGTWATADSTVTNTLNTIITNGLATVESKWAYNSALTINGTTYNSGFGLSNSAGTGIGSEFWIDASRFKFTNSAKTGSTAPFTIDASGATPQITFNGKVSFSNVVGVGGQYVNMIKNSEFQNSVNPWALGWNPNGSVITMFGLAENIHEPAWVIKGTTGSLTLFQNNRNSNTANDDVAIDLYPTPVYDSARGFSVIAGETYEFSVYAAAHRCDVQLVIQFFDTNLNHMSGIATGHVSVGGGGDSIESYSRVHTRMVAPAGARTALLVFRKHNTNPGVDLHSWIWIARPFFGMVSANSVAPVAYVASDSVESLYTPGTTTIDGGKITTGSVTANQIAASTITADKINTTGLIAQNILVPGANNNTPVFSASGNQVVIGNLKVLGTVSLPGISKGMSVGVPLTYFSGNTSTTLLSFYVYKPFNCTSWSCTVFAAVSCITQTSATRDLTLTIAINGSQVASAGTSDAYQGNVTTTTTVGDITDSAVLVSIIFYAKDVSAPYAYGNASCISIVQN